MRASLHLVFQMLLKVVVDSYRPQRHFSNILSGVLLALTAAFLVASVTGAHAVGAVERVAAAAQALWPAVVVASVPLRRRPAAGA